MDNIALLALVDSLVEDAIKNINLLEGPQGPRGLKGKDGIDFDFEQYRDEIISLIESHSNVSLTVGQLKALQGKDGKDGKDGESVYLEDVLESLVPKVYDKFEELKESFKLKFSDLSEEEIDRLRGPRGQRGKPGKDFPVEEAHAEIERFLTEYLSQIRPDLKLKFSDLSEEEKDGLKLKFSDLSEEEVLRLRGSRGQRGRPGANGENGLSAYDLSRELGFTGTLDEWIASLKGEIGPRGVQGIPGVTGARGISGINGLDGRDGKDGQDAPTIVDVIVEQINSRENEYVLILVMSDGSRIESQYFKLPKSQILQQFFGGGGGGSEMPINYITEIDTVDSSLTYVGEAAIGSEKSSSVWRIQRITKSGSSVEVLFADENDFFDNVWDDRASLIYG